MPDARLTGTNRLGAEPQRNLTFRIDGTTITYDGTQPNGTAVAGRAVGLKSGSPGIVELVADAQMVVGLLRHVEQDGACMVVTDGVVNLPSGDAAPGVGTRIVGGTLATARGYVRAASSAVAAETVAARGMVIDNAVTTALEVLLAG